MHKKVVTLSNLIPCLTLAVTLAMAGCERSDSTELRDVELRQDGHSLSYRVGGSGEPALVFIHGGISDYSVWDEAMNEFSEEHMVVALDLPGHGASDARDEYSPEVFSAAVRAVMEDAGAERAVLIGHSFGVAVSRDVALAEPERVVGIYMMDGLVAPLAGGDPEVVDPLLAGFASDAWQDVAAGFVEQFMIGSATNSDIADRIRTMMLSGTQAIWLAVLQIATSAELANDSVVPVPTSALFVPGATFTDGYGEYLRARFPDVVIELMSPETGHFLMWEAPEVFYGQLRALLERVER